jgi:hypothetical protein
MLQKPFEQKCDMITKVFAVCSSLHVISINSDHPFADSCSMLYCYLHCIVVLKHKNAKIALRTYLRGLPNRGVLYLTTEGDDKTRVEQ